MSGVRGQKTSLDPHTAPLPRNRRPRLLPPSTPLLAGLALLPQCQPSLDLSPHLERLACSVAMLLLKVRTRRAHVR